MDFGFGLFMELWLGFNGLRRLGVMAEFDEGDERFLAGDKVTVGFIRKWKDLSKTKTRKKLVPKRK